MTQINREYKDRLFAFIFGREENKAWTLSKQFLLEHKAEVKGMILTEYNEEEVMNGFKEEAYMDGVIKTLIDLVREQLLSISDAAKKLNVSEIEFKRLMEKV